MSLHGRKQKKIIKRKLDTVCNTIFKNKSIPADRAEIYCQTKMGTFTLLFVSLLLAPRYSERWAGFWSAL